MPQLPTLIFVATTHGFLYDFKKQKEVITRFKPTIILSEDLQNIRLDTTQKLRKALNTKQISETVAFNELHKLLELCAKNNIKMIGIDLKNFGFTTHLQRVVNERLTPTQEDEKHIKKILQKRTRHHIATIKKYRHETIAVFIGAWHLRENSPLLAAFSNCITIRPVDAKGNLVLEPPHTKKKIHYEEKKIQAEKINLP